MIGLREHSILAMRMTLGDWILRVARLTMFLAVVNGKAVELELFARRNEMDLQLRPDSRTDLDSGCDALELDD